MILEYPYFSLCCRQYDEKKRNLNKPCPQLRASFFNKIVFAWVSGLVWKGFRQPLKPEDLWDMNPKIASSGLVPIFDQHFETSKRKAAKDHALTTTAATFSAPDSVDLKSTKERSKERPFVSVFPALFKSFYNPFIFGGIMKIIIDLLSIATPQVIKLETIGIGQF